MEKEKFVDSLKVLETELYDKQAELKGKINKLNIPNFIQRHKRLLKMSRNKKWNDDLLGIFVDILETDHDLHTQYK